MVRGTKVGAIVMCAKFLPCKWLTQILSPGPFMVSEASPDMILEQSVRSKPWVLLKVAQKKLKKEGNWLHGYSWGTTWARALVSSQIHPKGKGKFYYCYQKGHWRNSCTAQTIPYQKPACKIGEIIRTAVKERKRVTVQEKSLEEEITMLSWCL